MRGRPGALKRTVQERNPRDSSILLPVKLRPACKVAIARVWYQSPTHSRFCFLIYVGGWQSQQFCVKPTRS